MHRYGIRLMVVGIGVIVVCGAFFRFASAQTCTLAWDIGDPNATETRIYVSTLDTDLRTNPSTLQATVPVAQTSIACATIGLNPGMYAAVDHRDSTGTYTESPLSAIVQNIGVVPLSPPQNPRLTYP